MLRFLVMTLLLTAVSGFSVGMPLGHDDIVEADGKQWLQVAAFTNLSWTDVSKVCDAQTGVCSGNLNGSSLNGWTWASIADLDSLYRYYIPELVRGAEREGVMKFLDDFRYSYSRQGDEFSVIGVWGLTRTILDDGRVHGTFVEVFGDFYSGLSSYGFYTGVVHPIDFASPFRGQLFFRDVPSAVPNPASLSLCLVGLSIFLSIWQRNSPVRNAALDP